MYFSFIYSRINYGIEIFYNCAKGSFSKLQIIQNKLIKLLLNANYRTPTNQIHNDTRILKVDDIMKMRLITFVNDCLLGNVPSPFTDYFSMRETNYSLRNYLLFVPRANTNIGLSSTKVIGSNLWNGITTDVKKFRHQKNFKKHLVNYYINTYK